MDVQVVEKNEIKVVGISWNGTYAQTNSIPEIFTEMEARINEVANQTRESVLIAPFHSRETEFTYYVTTPVEKIEDVPEGMIGFTIPRKNYVFATHKGRSEEVENTYLQMFKWMKEYGYELDQHALSLEIYKEEHKPFNSTGHLHYDIYLPVKKYKEI
ncbi:GyrI-like domain-containing protein [Neobacillus ginsengisoli]|uniref:Transcriptional regulator YdeE n=1 Tax=Neobacillus ginsengisoli TaxID=904295 RepID=A0ABT9XVQ4_9BACI|nr:GyrI-like domain-containing protein [Neobacillus ginsengisoli]MDQ0199652.1 putative transcriptional regulator YdeE [Neobacillus ginsengisoli]